MNTRLPPNAMMLLTVILLDLLCGMEFDLVVPSFPELQNQFSLTPFWVEALLSANFIGYCISLFFVGSLSDRYGRKPVILIGLALFIIGTVLCLAGTCYPLLLIGRFLQGIGIAAPAILSFLILADAYPLKQQQFYMAILNGIMNTSVAIAPVLGSYITLLWHWRGNFSALLILSIIALAMTLKSIPSLQRFASKDAESSSQYKTLLTSKPLLLLMTYIICFFVPYWVFVGMSPLLYIKSMHVSLAHFGYYQGVLALVFAIGSVLFGLILHRFNPVKLLWGSTFFYLLSLVSVVCVTASNTYNPLFITLGFIPFVISQIIPGTLLGTLCINYLPQAKGKINAVLQGFRLIFASVCLQIAGYFYQGNFRNIGMIISLFITMVVITHIFVIRNQEIMAKVQQ